MSQIDKEQLNQQIDAESPEQLERVKAIFDVQEDTSGQVDAALATSESVEVDPRLTRYNEMYNKWSLADRAKAPWKFVQERLLSKDYLAKAEAMNEGGVLFGIDLAGNPLVADGGVKPIMTGKNYANARKAVMGEEKTPTGYILFPYVEPYTKSPEIMAFERFTGEPFVRSEDKKTWRSSWLDSGENDANVRFARVAYFDPGVKHAYVCDGSAVDGYDRRGVRRLLRVEE